MQDKKIKEVIDSYNNNFDLVIEIEGKRFTVQKEVWDLIINISLERDKLIEKAN